MRLSDAIAMGRTLMLPWVPGNHGCDENGNNRGCALMLASMAINGTNDFSCLAFEHSAIQSVRGSYFGYVKADLPCGCTTGEWLDGEENLPTLQFHRAVMHVFNQHCAGDGSWTLDQLIDWVRSVEPEEDDSSPAPAPAELPVTTEVWDD